MFYNVCVMKIRDNSQGEGIIGYHICRELTTVMKKLSFSSSFSKLWLCFARSKTHTIVDRASYQRSRREYLNVGQLEMHYGDYLTYQGTLYEGWPNRPNTHLSLLQIHMVSENSLRKLKVHRYFKCIIKLYHELVSLRYI